MSGTLRDHFAAAALQGLLANGIHTSDLSYRDTAKLAYVYADAMLEARGETE